MISTAIVASIAGLMLGAYSENQIWSAMGLFILLGVTLSMDEHPDSRNMSRG